TTTTPVRSYRDRPPVWGTASSHRKPEIRGNDRGGAPAACRHPTGAWCAAAPAAATSWARVPPTATPGPPTTATSTWDSGAHPIADHQRRRAAGGGHRRGDAAAAGAGARRPHRGARQEGRDHGRLEQ